MNEWFQSRTPRERRVLIGGALVLVMVLMYAMLLAPLLDRRAMLERGLGAQRELAAWLEVNAPRLQPGSRPSGGSLFAVVDRSARATPMAGALQRIQPEGDSTVRVWLDGASFDELVRWIGTLERDHGVSVSALTVERANAAGLVNARVTLDRAP